MPRHWQVLILAALGIGATLVAVPRALSGIVAVPQGGSDPGISRTGPATQTAKANTATVPGWSPSASTSSVPTDTKPPSLVANLRVMSNTESTAVVSWDPSSDNVAVRGYVVRADGASVETPAPPVSFPWSRHPGSFTVQVAAVDSSGNQGAWRSILVNQPKGTAATTQAAVTTAPVEVTTAPASTTPTETTTATTTAPPSSEAPLDTTPPSQAAVPPATSGAPADQGSSQPI